MSDIAITKAIEQGVTPAPTGMLERENMEQ
jgi:hypothetical protein